MTSLLLRLAALGGALAVAVAVFVMAASFELGFWPLALLALAAFVLAGFTLLRWSMRASVPADRTVSVWRWLLGGAAAYAIVAQLLVGRTPVRTLTAAEPTPETKFWTLPTGSRIAYELAPARGGSRAHPPVIALHDGPGMPALPFLHALGSRPLDVLQDEGYDVYYYDQVGAGLSGRLDLTKEGPYTVARHVADLEAIREAIGAPTVILAGTGWGATLATSYLLTHADRVDKLILESPAALWAPAWSDMVNPAARARMTDVQASALAALQRPPLRLVLGRMMADFSPRAAHRFVADWEADQWWTRTTEESIRLGQPNYTCHSDPGHGIPAPSGMGFFAHSYTLADAIALPDPREALRRITTQALIIRGTCDYIDWPVSAEYLKVMRGGHYVAIPSAGHFIWLEQRALWDEVVRAFVRGEKIPLEAYDPGTSGR